MYGRSAKGGRIQRTRTAFIPDRTLIDSGTIQTGRRTVGAKTPRRLLGHAVITAGIHPSSDPGVARLLHNDDPRRPRLLVIKTRSSANPLPLPYPPPTPSPLMTRVTKRTRRWTAPAAEEEAEPRRSDGGGMIPPGVSVSCRRGRISSIRWERRGAGR